MPRLPHICELDLSLQPLEANIPPSIKRLSVPEPIHDHNHEHEHEHGAGDEIEGRDLDK